MTECTLDSSAVDWVVEYPETMNLLEGLGIDCTCAGKSLGFECRRQGLDPGLVLLRLNRAVEAGRGLRDRSDPDGLRPHDGGPKLSPARHLLEKPPG